MKYQTTENVQSIPIKEIQPFRNHPFTVADNEDMAKIVESIGKVGTITPLLARPLPDGGYELISGHRRLEACHKLRLDTIPVIVREMTDDEAGASRLSAPCPKQKQGSEVKAMAEKVYEMFTEYNDVVTVEEVMEMLHLGRVTVYNLLKTDKIHTLRVGKKYVIPKKSVIDFLAA